MAAYAAFRRQPVPQQFAQNLQTITIPAPMRGIIQSENEAFMQPGGAVVQTNWGTTMKGVKVRGGYERWCDLYATGVAKWVTAHAYTVGNRVYDTVGGSFWLCAEAHTSTSAIDGTFALDRAAHPTYWTNDDAATGTRLPVVSAFEYVSDTNIQRMYAGTATSLYDVTDQHTPTLIKAGQASGNYCACQMNNNAGVVYMIVVNDAGDFALRTSDGNAFFLLSGVIGNAGDGVPNITYDPAKLPAGVAQGTGLVYAWKYRNRLYFIQKNSMNAWYLDTIDAVGGVLKPIYLAGASNRGGKLLFGATWSIDAGDGTDDKCVFVTDLGDVLIFTGSNPGDAANWRQEGRYQISAPLGMNAHTLLGGDLIILTTEGAVPLSQAISKDSGALDLALLTKNIKPMWRNEVTDANKRYKPWTIRKWDEYGAIFVATPGGTRADTKHCLVVNNATGAWFVYTWDATCWIRMRAFMFFGTQDGKIMWADRHGHDDGRPYTCTLVGGWETFQSGANQVTWHQARAIFLARPSEPFQPQITSAVDNITTIPQPPPIGEEAEALSVWDEGLWDEAMWDDGVGVTRTTRNTMWVSIGTSGFAHAPVVQVQIKQNAPPTVELIAIGTTQERGGVNV
jgi:hypothetical protein